MVSATMMCDRIFSWVISYRLFPFFICTASTVNTGWFLLIYIWHHFAFPRWQLIRINFKYGTIFGS